MNSLYKNRAYFDTHTRSGPNFIRGTMLLAATLAALVSVGTLHAEETTSAAPTPQAVQGTGTIEGRVYFPGAERYLENVQVRVEGTNLETMSESDGSYRLIKVPAGTVKITAAFVGFTTQSRTVAVTPGQTAALDIDLTTTGTTTTKGKTGDDVVKLDKYVVTSTKEEFGAAIALQEQRHAANMKFVVAADEFGENPSGNIGEFLAHIPGVNVVNSGGEARTISIEGTPAAFTPVTYNGFDMASAASGGSGRQVELDTISLNNLARAEVIFAPTPESPGNALAGSVNLIPRSAFERSRPQFTFKTFITLSQDSFTLNKTAGPWYTPTRKAGPNAEFTYTVPYNKRFGFTISAARAFYLSDKSSQRIYWRGSAAGTDGTNFPHTSPDNPYLSGVDLTVSKILADRSSFSLTADYRLARNDRLSLAFQYSNLDQKYADHMFHAIMQKMITGDLTTAHSTGQGYLRQEQQPRRKTSTNYMPTLTYNHIGPLWKIDAGLSYSKASTHYTDTPQGFFQNAYADRGNVTIAFENIDYIGPQSITASDTTTKAPINPYALDDYALVKTYSRPVDATDERIGAYLDVRRDLLIGSIPVFLKAGVNVKQAERAITNRPDINWTYLGPDGKTSNAGGTVMGAAGSTDDGAKPFIDPNYSSLKMPYGHPNIEWMDLSSIYQLYNTNPSYFSLDADTATNDQRAQTATETISAAYFRGDIQLFNRRLSLVGGVRGEETEVQGKGPLKQTIGGHNVWVKYGGVSDVSFTNWFPSVNATFKVNPSGSLLLKAAYFESIGRPDYNQYMGGITLPNLDSPSGALGSTITINNPAIKPWTAQTIKVMIEYYFARTAVVTASAFTRKFNNFFVTTTAPVTPEMLSYYGLDYNEYSDYYMSTQFNSQDTATVNGVSLYYKQTLGFLPVWMRNVTVSAGANFQTVSGAGEPNFYGGTNDSKNGQIVPQSYSAGITYNRKNRIILRADWNYTSEYKTDVIRVTGVPPGTYTWQTAHNYINLSGEYNFGKFGVYFSVRNITAEPQNNYEIRGPNTPKSTAFRLREEYAAQWTFGLKGTF